MKFKDKSREQLVEEIDLLSAKVEKLEKLVEKNINPQCNDIMREMKVAGRVHRTLLPQPTRGKLIDIDVRYLPYSAVGGDYCQVLFPDSETCYITECDVTGHGIGAAMLATRISSEVRRFVMEEQSPKDIVNSLNKFLLKYFNEVELYPSFFASRIDLKDKRITWSGAGHPSPFLIRKKTRKIERLLSQNSIIGVQEKILSDNPEDSLDLESGDRVLLYSDGLIDAVSSDGRMLCLDGFSEIVLKTMDSDIFDMADNIINEVDRYRNNVRTDDELLIVAEIK